MSNNIALEMHKAYFGPPDEELISRQAAVQEYHDATPQNSISHYEDFLNALEEHTLATINNRDNVDTYAGHQYREQAEDRLKYSRENLIEELAKLLGAPQPAQLGVPKTSFAKLIENNEDWEYEE